MPTPEKNGLVLSRKPGETVIITVPASAESTEVTVKYVKQNGAQARLGFHSDPSVNIARSELKERQDVKIQTQ